MTVVGFRFLQPPLRSSSYQLDHQAGRRALRFAARHNPQTASVSPIIAYRPSGQPYLANSEGAFCSVAHSHGWGIAAVDTHPIGVDIERLRPHRPELLSVITSDKELHHLRHHVSDKEDKLLTVVWTMKEAVLKAIGLGLLVSPRSLEIKEIKNGQVTIEDKHKGQNPSRWSVWQRWEKEFCISVARPAEMYDTQPIFHWYQ